MTGARRPYPKPDDMEHQRLLMAIRIKNHWTQAELANALQLSSHTISRYERGETDPHPDLVPVLKLMLVNDWDYGRGLESQQWLVIAGI